MKDSWKRRWFLIRFCVFAIVGFGIGMYFIDAEKAQAISGPIIAICTSLAGIVSLYAGIATADDHSKRLTDPKDD